MFEPVVIVNAKARHEDMLNEAAAARRLHRAGPAEARQYRWRLRGLLLALGLAVR